MSNKQTQVKFLWNGIKVDGKLYPVWYSKGGYGDKYPTETIGISVKDYQRLPKIEGLEITNESESQVDYFDNDRIKVFPTNPHYPAVNAALNAYNKHRERVRMKRATR